MDIINLKKYKILAWAAGLALLVGAFGYSQTLKADHTDIHIEGSAGGSVIFDGNATSTELASFSPDLNLASSTSATLQSNATTSATAYYGVDIESGTTTGDVYWRITVSHAAEALATGDVSITEKGYYDADGGAVEDSAYVATESSGDLVFSGNAGWEVFDGDMFTNVDAIVFDDNAPLGTYTVTRSLIDNSTSSDPVIDAAFVFTVNLLAVSPTSTPVITLNGDNPDQVFSCNGFVEPGFSAVDSTGASITATSSGAIDVSEPGTYTITYTATDSEGNTATTTRTVISIACSSGGGGGGGGGSSGTTGIERAAQVTPQGSVIPGQAIGLNIFQQTLFPPGQVLGAFFPGLPATAGFFQFTSDLSVGMRGSEVIELQSRLTQTGYYKGPITGFFGSLTRAAVMRFQRAHGLSATGVVDAQMRLLLNS